MTLEKNMSHSFQLKYCNFKPLLSWTLMPPSTPTVSNDMEFTKLHLNCTGLMSASSISTI